MIPRLLQRYKEQIIPELSKKFGYKNSLAAPRLQKIVLNMGVGPASQDIKVLEQAMAELSLISGQKSVITRAKKSIANFKIRKGVPVGCKVTVRGIRMYEFLDRLLNVALPRIRDFRGVSANSFDENGNYSLGLREQTVFPEVDIDKVTRAQGMDVIIHIKSNSIEESYELLKLFGMPFVEEGKK
jgi:large subunit ribosomal protein L5